jgi:hypothetical protein
MAQEIMSKEKLEKARDLISEVIMENKDNWDKQYIWLSKLLHCQGALKDSISELNEKELRVKKPLVGER